MTHQRLKRNKRGQVTGSTETHVRVLLDKSCRIALTEPFIRKQTDISLTEACWNVLVITLMVSERTDGNVDMRMKNSSFPVNSIGKPYL